MRSWIRFVASLVVLLGSAIAAPALADECSMFTSFAEGANQQQQINEFTLREGATSDCRIGLVTVTFRMSVAEEELSSGWLSSAVSQLGGGLCSVSEAADAIRAARWTVIMYVIFPNGSYTSSPVRC